jgi:hypothetical protein
LSLWSFCLWSTSILKDTPTSSLFFLFFLSDWRFVKKYLENFVFSESCP